MKSNDDLMTLCREITYDPNTTPMQLAEILRILKERLSSREFDVFLTELEYRTFNQSVAEGQFSLSEVRGITVLMH